MTPVSVNRPVPERALAVGAHPDDIEFGAGATLAKWAAHGCALLHVVCTDGSKGSWDPAADTARLVATRQDEQRAASRALGGAGEVVFLGWPDGELESGVRQRSQVASAIRRFRPDVVLGHDPWQRYRLHPDHRHAGFLTVDGVVAARDPHFFPEQDLRHHRPAALLLFEADEPDHVEDAEAFVEAKIAALLAHRSQLRSTMHIDDASSPEEVAAFRAAVIDDLRRQGALAGIAMGEAFRAMTDL
jgi:LmbE family N-acetylglucosaminyl deacetylase